jgi:hypothetical protein
VIAALAALPLATMARATMALATMALATMATAGAAQAQVVVEDNYPAAMNRQVLSAWLQDATDLKPDQVVAVSPSTATAIVQRTPLRDGKAQARLRAVAVSRQAVARGGVLAWEMSLDVDCKSRQVRAGATTGYATRRGDGDGLALAPADETWRKPKAGTILEASWRAVCDARFQSPLSGAPLRLAETRPTALPPPPPAAVPAPPVVTASAAPRLTPAHLTLPAQTPPRPKTRPDSAPPPKTAAAAAPARRLPIHAAAKAGANAVQVVSSPVETDTRRKLERLQRRFGPALQEGVEIRIVQAKVDGRTVFRGVVAGFDTRREARAFCQTLKQGGQDCVAW